MEQKSRKKRIGRTILEMLEKRGTVANDLLYSRIEKKYPDLTAREFSASIEQLETLELIASFDAGYDIRYEITRKGVCFLCNQ